MKAFLDYCYMYVKLVWQQDGKTALLKVHADAPPDLVRLLFDNGADMMWLYRDASFLRSFLVFNDRSVLGSELAWFEFLTSGNELKYASVGDFFARARASAFFLRTQIFFSRTRMRAHRFEKKARKLSLHRIPCYWHIGSPFDPCHHIETEIEGKKYKICTRIDKDRASLIFVKECWQE